jgi:V/A-type H+/Na+-transporting ATPase subunit I
MIEPMARARVAARHEDRERLLEALRAQGVLHLVPARTDSEGDQRELADELARTRQALQVLKETEPGGETPRGTVSELVAETLELRRRGQELRARLATLQRESREAAVWGHVTAGRMAELARHGVPLRVVVAANSDVAAIPGLVIPVGPLDDRRSLMVCVGDVEAELPARVTLLDPPVRDPATLEREIGEIRAALDAAPRRLARLARRREELARALVVMEDERALRQALRTGLRGARLYGVEGWVPAARAASLAAGLRAAGIDAAVHLRPALPDERPPTLVRYPRGLRPIRALFDLLGVRPGYDEADPTAFFMVAMPVFAGMLIADAGYGLVFLLGSLVARRRLRNRAWGDALELVMVFGVAALVWGAVSGSWFGVPPSKMQGAGGAFVRLGGALSALQLIRGSEQEARDTLIKFSFLLGSTHLVLAHLRRVVALAPDTSALADLGWCGVLGAMLGVIWHLFFRDAPLPMAVTRVLLGAGVLGFSLVAAFSTRDPNPLVRVAKGVGGGLFPLIGAFGDTLSYIRLAAVGLAGFYLAVAIDALAVQAAGAATWLAALPILLVGHALNMTLSLVAILAHGVRLNLLEFSSHTGLQWAGYPYRPFAARPPKEQ